MSEAEVEPVKYVSLDVVGFTHRRSVEAQADVVAHLNSIVRGATQPLKPTELIFLPTGDGMIVCIVGKSSFDCHVRLALDILAEVAAHNEGIQDAMRQYHLRIGVNQNDDNVVEDINGQRNVAGTGVNMVSRIMEKADPDQILVSASVHDVLSTRERYLECFRPYSTKIKHGHEIKVFQYLLNETPGLNSDAPSAFRPERPPERRMTEFEAYYLAHGLRLRRFLLDHQNMGIGEYASIVLLYFLAKDSLGVAHQTEANPYHHRIYGGGAKSDEEVLGYYSSVDFWLVCLFAISIKDSTRHMHGLFEKVLGSVAWYLPSEKAASALTSEHPSIAQELGVEPAA